MNSSGGARPRASGSAPHILLRLAYYAGRPGRLLAEIQSGGEGLRLARSAISHRGPRRPGRSVSAGVCQRDQVDGRAGSDLEEGESQGLPVWSRHVGDPILESNITRRVDFALFMVEALENDELIHEAPAIVGCQRPSALAHK